MLCLQSGCSTPCAPSKKQAKISTSFQTDFLTPAKLKWKEIVWDLLSLPPPQKKKNGKEENVGKSEKVSWFHVAICLWDLLWRCTVQHTSVFSLDIWERGGGGPATRDSCTWLQSDHRDGFREWRCLLHLPKSLTIEMLNDEKRCHLETIFCSVLFCGHGIFSAAAISTWNQTVLFTPYPPIPLSPTCTFCLHVSE